LGIAVSTCVLAAAIAWANTTFSINAYFTPDKLGAPTNLSAKAVFSYGAVAPMPIDNFLAYAPAGLGVDVRGTGVCQKASLEANGPNACPADSRIGFGGGVGIVEIAKEFIKAPFTFDLFLAPRENGRLVILVYVTADNPVSLQLVLVAREVRGAKPYGFGVNVEVPPIPTLPGAAYASVESTYLSVGSQKIAYFHTVRGKRRLLHVKGLIVPKICPRGGFPFLVTIGFVDGTSSSDRYTAPCPRP
jgi:hypothetical protein